VSDYAIARRILDAHQRKGEPPARTYAHDQMQRYIMFARCFQPVVSILSCLIAQSNDHIPFISS